MQLSELKPVKGKVLIRKDKQSDETRSGIVLGKSDKGRIVTAEILSGDKAGSRIVFNPGVSNNFDVEGDKVYVIFESDIIGYL